jgi:hypothetical protein
LLLPTITLPTVVGGILLAGDEELRVEELTVVASADLVDGLWCLVRAVSRAFDVGGWAEGRTEGSRSTKMERGTYLPELVSVKKVSKAPPSST